MGGNYAHKGFQNRDWGQESQEEGYGSGWTLCTVCLHNLLRSAIVIYFAFSCSYLVAQNINFLGKLIYELAQFQHYIDLFSYLPISYERFCIPEKHILTDQTVYIQCSYSKRIQINV